MVKYIKNKGRGIIKSFRVHRQRSLEVGRLQTPKAKAFLEEFLVNGELHPARQMLPSHKRLDNICDAALFVNIDQRLEVHGRRQGRQSRKHFGMRRGVEMSSFRINADDTIRSSRIN